MTPSPKDPLTSPIARRRRSGIDAGSVPGFAPSRDRMALHAGDGSADGDTDALIVRRAGHLVLAVVGERPPAREGVL